MGYNDAKCDQEQGKLEEKGYKKVNAAKFDQACASRSQIKYDCKELDCNSGYRYFIKEKKQDNQDDNNQDDNNQDDNNQDDNTPIDTGDCAKKMD